MSNINSIFHRDEKAKVAYPKSKQQRNIAPRNAMSRADREEDSFQIVELSQIPNSLEAATSLIKRLLLAKIDKETKQKQLYYHNRVHAIAVQSRTRRIWQAIAPWRKDLLDTEDPDYEERVRLLLDLCAIAHDLEQHFLPTKPELPRQRKSGVSERATVTELANYIHYFNQKFRVCYPQQPLLFNQQDLEIINHTILATTCLYDKTDDSLYQPELYQTTQPFLTARILALADLGTLGIDGVNAFLRESKLVFLEENPNLAPLLLSSGDRARASEIVLGENLRQQLLKQATFLLNFAKGRQSRLNRELAGLPVEAIEILKQDIFQHLNKTAIARLELLIPTADTASLIELIDFFKVDSL